MPRGEPCPSLSAGVWYTTHRPSGASAAMPLQLVVEPINQDFSLKGHIYDVLKQGIMSMNIYAADAKLRLDERQLSEQRSFWGGWSTHEFRCRRPASARSVGR